MTHCTPSGLVEPSLPPIFTLVSSPPPPRSPRLIPRRSRGLLSFPRELRRAGHGTTVSHRVGGVPWPQKGWEQTCLDLLFPLVRSEWKTEPRSSRISNTGELLTADNGRRRVLPRHRPPPPLSPPFHLILAVHREIDGQKQLIPLRGSFFLKRPHPFSNSRLQSSAREILGCFLICFKSLYFAIFTILPLHCFAYKIIVLAPI